MALERNDGSGPEVWSTEAFIRHFVNVHHKMPERSFAFVLGAGASASSGIATGSQLVDRWLDELQLRDPKSKDLSVEDWATSDSLHVDDFDYDRRAEFYPQIYHRRFRDDLEEGYAYLEDVMKDAEPSLGYSMLAQILAGTQHKVAITTNFDNLIADSVLFFTDTFAQICGHESLTGFIRVQPRRPLVAKIHRDLLLGPQNYPYETALLHEDWARELRKLFAHCTPLFIGYGGNDGSLMNFLESLSPRGIPGGIFWAYRDGGGLPNKRIRRLVARQAGKLIPILNFDVFMTQLAEPLEFGLLDGMISSRTEKRVTRLRDEWDEVKKSVDESVEEGKDAGILAREALGKVETRRAEEGDTWWSWDLRAKLEPDPTKREAIYREGLQRLPNSAELTTNFALFMVDIRKQYDDAERLYRRALELDPDHATITGGFALFMTEIRKEHDEAERLYRRALEQDPDHATNNANFTQFIMSRGQMSEAKKRSDRAWDLAKGNSSQVAAAVALYRSLMLRLDGQEDESGLGRLHTLLKTGFNRRTGYYDVVLESVDAALGEDDRILYGAVAAAILDRDKVAALDAFPRWREVSPIPLDEPWSPLGD